MPPDPPPNRSSDRKPPPKVTLVYKDEAPDERQSDDLELLAHWLDTVFEIPVLRWRFGLDALLGLIPGFGDTASAFASIYILRAATNFGVSRATMARMTLNIVLDLIVGAIPFAGDVFDVVWKANKRNVALLRRHLEATPATERKLQRDDRLFVAAMIALICMILVASVAAAYYLLSHFVAALARLLA